MPTIFFTGFPGFLGSELLPRVLERSPHDRAVCLVQPKFLALAERRRAELVLAHPSLGGRIELVAGDITRSDLGLEADTARELVRETTEIYHLAAVYDLAVAREVGLAVNVDGTRHLLELAGRSEHLARFQYVSTCYVSGRWEGTFREEDLEGGQTFNNFYEETKYLADVEVQRAMADGLPATVYRPAIVVGDSTTGATQKYDGPYYVIRWLLKQGPVAFLPVVGDPSQVRINLVPRDFVVEAIAHLSGLPEAEGTVYQLADPRPLTVAELIDAIGRAVGKRVVRLPTPAPVAKGAIEFVPFVERILGIPSPAIDYFTHPTRYATRNTRRDLAGSGIDVPRFERYVDRLVDFVRRHPEVGSEAMA